MQKQSLLDAIGNTPLVEIGRLNPNPRVTVLAKLEYVNPGGSIKDRAALSMIEAGEASGALTPEKTVIEATSGNTGIGLALVCAVKGYRLLLAMSEAVSVERQKILKARGAELLMTPSHLGTDGAIEEVYRLVRENPDRYFMTDQYNNPANWQAHYRGTAAEIWRQTEGRVSMVVATLGTSGTLMGVSRRLKELEPSVAIVGVEPYLGHKIQGLKNLKESYRPEIFEKQLLDRKINIDDEEAFEMARLLARKEGLFVGMSSGAAVAAALKEAREMSAGMIVAILPDSGERYLSTPLFKEENKVVLHLFNTLSRSKEPFAPIEAGRVGIFSDGPTADAPLHIGEIRRMVFADLLVRYLAFRGYAVNHVVNVTDLDDRTLAGSEAAGISLEQFTEHHIQSFEQDYRSLGIRLPGQFHKTSEHIDEMVDLAEKLVLAGFAYEKLRSLYFDISRFKDYGRLSGIDLNKIRLGATVDLDEYEKANPRDFTLFKRARLSELKRGNYIQTRWGSVRPSWHIQSVAIAMLHLGTTYDIHTGGRELVFPHHENERAIAEAVTGKPLARYWLHCDRVMVDGKKIAASAVGLTLKDFMAKGYSGKQIRYWLLASHYRKPVVYSERRLNNTCNSLKRLNDCLRSLQQRSAGSAYPDLNQLLYDLKHGFTSAMDDDLNIPVAMARLFKFTKTVNRLLQDGWIDRSDAQKIREALGEIDAILGIYEWIDPSQDAQIQQLLRERQQARRQKDWQRADAIRDRLLAMGVAVRDAKIEA